MGFFLASNPEPSLMVLARLSELQKTFDLPMLIGVSRKSFLKNLPARPDDAGHSGGGEPDACDIETRTLAAELYAAQQGVSYIRTHDARSLREGLRTIEAISTVVLSNY